MIDGVAWKGTIPRLGIRIEEGLEVIATGNLHSSQGEIIMDLFKQLHNEGMTILQATHSEKNAQYGARIIQIEDGFVRSDIPV